MTDEKVVLQVEGMTCSNCAQGITRHLGKKGLKNLWVSFDKGEVEYNLNGDIPISFVIDEINSMGYHAVEKNEEISQKVKGLSSLEIRFLIAAIFTLPLTLHMLLNWTWLHNGWIQLLLCLPVLYIGLTYFGKSAFGALRNGQTNMDVLITIGAVSAFIYSLVGLIISTNAVEMRHFLFFETSAVIITLVLLGNLIEQKSLKKTSSAVESLLNLQPIIAKRIVNSLTVDEKIEEIEIGTLKKNDLVLVNSGDKIPADGRIYWGNASIDESSMTGESMLSVKGIDDTVLAGTIIIDGSIKVIADEVGNNTVLNNIIELVSKATQNKPAIQRWGDKVSAWFVPVVLLISLFTFLISYFMMAVPLTGSFLRSIAVLVISCPCAMGLATPTAVAVAVGRAAKEGILIKGGHLLELMSESAIIVFDKTGTLTEPILKVKKINYIINEDLARYVIFTLEQYSTHPTAKAMIKEIQNNSAHSSIKFASITEEKGLGVKAKDVEGNNYLVGSYNWACDLTDDRSHQVYVIMNNVLLATIDFEEVIRSDASATLQYFNEQHFKTILLSGDRLEKCNDVAEKLGIQEVYGEKMPAEKLEIIEKLKRHGKVIMVGDGVNDSPALAVADIGVSFGRNLGRTRRGAGRSVRGAP